MAKIIYSDKGIMANRPENSSVFRDMMKKPGMAQAFNTHEERHKLYSALREEGLKDPRGITEATMERVIKDLKQDHGTMDRKELTTLGKDFTTGNKWQRDI
jgi:hypothetical protein